MKTSLKLTYQCYKKVVAKTAPTQRATLHQPKVSKTQTPKTPTFHPLTSHSLIIAQIQQHSTEHHKNMTYRIKRLNNKFMPNRNLKPPLPKVKRNLLSLKVLIKKNKVFRGFCKNLPAKSINVGLITMISIHSSYKPKLKCLQTFTPIKNGKSQKKKSFKD